MIFVRAPLRLEFLGGGTDIQYFYSRQTGYVLNASIDKYIYVALHRHNRDDIRITGPDGHDRIRAALKEFNIHKGIEIAVLSDITAKGSGLGSSSSFMVALVHALSILKGKRLSAVDIAEMACHIEIDILHEPIGKQDQYAAAFGGMLSLIFQNNGHVNVKKIVFPEEIRQSIHSHLLLFWTGATRLATDILKEQASNFENNFIHLKRMAELVPNGVHALVGGDLRAFAGILEAEWMIKKKISQSISNIAIEDMYQKAKNAGAWGGRVSGAGGGGFMMLIAPPHTHLTIRQVLAGKDELTITLTENGSEVIFQDNN